MARKKGDPPKNEFSRRLERMARAGDPTKKRDKDKIICQERRSYLDTVDKNLGTTHSNETVKKGKEVRHLTKELGDGDASKHKPPKSKTDIEKDR